MDTPNQMPSSEEILDKHKNPSEDHSRKRKATASPTDSSPRRSHPLDLDDPSVSAANMSSSIVSSKPATALPEPGSINDIIRKHCRSRLYVKPITWTMDQLRLLECHFVSQEPGSEWARTVNTEETSKEAKLSASQLAALQQRRLSLATMLRRPNTARFKMEIIEALLKTYNLTSPFLGQELYFKFAEEAVAYLELDAVFYDVSQVAVLACIQQDTIWMQREKGLGRKLRRRGSVETELLREKRLRAIQPANHAEDPYIAALLIVLAQYQRDRIRKQELEHQSPARRENGKTQVVGVEQPEVSSNAAGPFLVRLLVIPTAREEFVQIYETSIPLAFLDKLETPSRLVQGGQVEIRYSQLSLKNPEVLVKQLSSFLPMFGSNQTTRKVAGL